MAAKTRAFNRSGPNPSLKIFLGDKEEVICDDNSSIYVVDPVVEGEKKARGLVPRDYDTCPQGFYKGAPAIDKSFPLIDKSEYPNRIADKIKEGSQLSDIRKRGKFGSVMPSTDQNGRGYCWFHSGTSCVLIIRACMGLPYVSLSAYAGACVIKNFRDEGGWGAQGVDFLVERGVPSEEFWPQRATKREYDNPATWENAKKYRVTEGFWDVAPAQYDRNLTFDQVCTLLLTNTPIVGDFNWWGHSVCLLDVVNGAAQRRYCRVESGKKPQLKLFDRIWDMNNPVTAGYSIRLWNSWGDSWSENGTGIITGNKAIPDGSVAPAAVAA